MTRRHNPAESHATAARTINHAAEVAKKRVRSLLLGPIAADVCGEIEAIRRTWIGDVERFDAGSEDLAWLIDNATRELTHVAQAHISSHARVRAHYLRTCTGEAGA